MAPKPLRFEKAALVAFDRFYAEKKKCKRRIIPAMKQPKGEKKRFLEMSDEEKQLLQRNIIAGLPGSEESFTVAQFQEALDKYDGIDEDTVAQSPDLFFPAGLCL